MNTVVGQVPITGLVEALRQMKGDEVIDLRFNDDIIGTDSSPRKIMVWVERELGDFQPRISPNSLVTVEKEVIVRYRITIHFDPLHGPNGKE